MIQTIVLIQNGKYPFGQVALNKRSIKVQDIKEYSSIEELKFHKNKMQQLFTLKDRSSHTTITQTQPLNIIKLLKIYQSDLRLHYLFEYVPYSLQQFIENKLPNNKNIQKANIVEMNSKLLIKKIYYELGSIINYLVKFHIQTNLSFDLLGIDQDQNLRLFVNPSCEVIPIKYNQKQQYIDQGLNQAIQQDLRKFYQWKKEQILKRLQKQFLKLKNKDKYIPNFIIQGNKLVFCHSNLQSSQDPSTTPSMTSFTQSSITDRSENVNRFINNFQAKPNDQDQNLRRTHGNLFSRLHKKKSGQYISQTNAKIQQNFRKLQMLRQKSKKLNDQVYQNYLSSSQNASSRDNINNNYNDNNNINNNNNKYEQQRNNFHENSTFDSHCFKKMQNNQQGHWRNSQIPKKMNNNNNQQPKQNIFNRFRNNNNFENKRSKSTRTHKNSFQFKPQKNEKQWFNPNKSFDKNYDDDYQDKSFHQKKSIRIQLQQTTLGNKQRKNSYKVKILTCQQMQLDGDNVQQFVFNTMTKNFSNKQQQNNQQDYNDKTSQDDIYSQTSARSKTSNQNYQFNNIFGSNNKQKNQEQNLNFSNTPLKSNTRQRARQSSSQKNIFQKYYEQFGKQQQKSGKNSALQQKIRLAKQKAENVLNKYMKTKKNSQYNSNSKLGL